MSPPSIGFIGFGEAGFHIARGLKEAGVTSITAYDLNADTPGLGKRIEDHSSSIGVELRPSIESLVGDREILLSTVTADAAVAAASDARPFLNPTHLYVDLNSVSPGAKQEIDQIVRGAGARFVEATIMSPVPPKGHRAPMLLAGPDAGDLERLLSPYGMQLEVVSDTIGAAGAVKLCRSIIVKGLEALMIESSLAACHYGADERVFASLSESFPGLDWEKLASYMTSRVALHGERRAREMDEAVRMLESIGIDPMMSSAAARRQEWCAQLGLKDWFGGNPPEDYRAIAKAIETLSGRTTEEETSTASTSSTEDSYHG